MVMGSVVRGAVGVGCSYTSEIVSLTNCLNVDKNFFADAQMLFTVLRTVLSSVYMRALALESDIKCTIYDIAT